MEYEKVEKLFELKGVTPYKVSKDLGYSLSLFPNWRKGISTPKHDKIKEIAEYFNVPVSYFYDDGDENKEYYTNLATNYLAQRLRDDQKALMKSAADLTPDEVKAVDLFIKALKGEADK